MEKSSGNRSKGGVAALRGFWNRSERNRRIVIAGVAAAVIVVALIIWLIASSGSDSSSSPAPSPEGSGKTVSVVGESELLGTLKGVGYPVYWAGPRIDTEYEVSRLTDGRTYVRYLPKGEEAESDTPFLTIGSYEQENALADLRKLGQAPGAILVNTPGGGSAYAEGTEATSAYMAFPGVPTQIEVYDPEGGKALQLIRSGAIVPIG